MAIIQFSNGIKVNFNGTPTQQDIDEIARKVGAQPAHPGIQDFINKGAVNGAQPAKQGVLNNLTGAVGQGLGNYFHNIKNDFQERGQNLIASGQDVASGKQSFLSGQLQSAGQVTGMVGDFFGEALQPSIHQAADALAGNSTFKQIANSPAGAVSDGVNSALNSYTEWARQHPEASRNLEATVNIGTLLLGEKPAQSAVNTVGEAASKVANKGISAASEVSKFNNTLASQAEKTITNSIVKSKPVEGIVGEITQSAKKDIPTNLRALSSIDTKGVKTYADFGLKIKDKISELAKLVDNKFSEDAVPRQLPDMLVKSKTTSGTPVNVDYVSRALKNLSELYSSTGDDVAEASMNEMIDLAKSNGLTRNEVNGLARLYNEEFGAKAFNKIGDPLTSVSAQSYENTRKGLKLTAKQDFAGKDAITGLDKQISELKTLQKYTNKMEEAVSKLTNKVKERGLIEKIAAGTGTAVDVVTGGFFKSFLSKFIPSNVGLKTLNSIDLEAALKKNLELVNKALKAKTDEELVRQVTKLKSTPIKPIKVKK